jgi:hypothetical protein
MKTYYWGGGKRHAFLTSALQQREWSASRPDSGTHCIGGWVGPKAGLDAVEKGKIPSFRRESNTRTPVVQPVSSCSTDWVNSYEMNDPDNLSYKLLPVNKTEITPLHHLLCIDSLK